MCCKRRIFSVGLWLVLINFRSEHVDLSMKGTRDKGEAVNPISSSAGSTK
jgi:hypothetical protein